MNVTRTAVAVAGLVLALHPSTAAAQVTVGQLQARIVALENLAATLKANIDAEAAARVAADDTLQQNIDNGAMPQNLLDLASYVSVDPGTLNDLAGPHVIFSGANVHVRNGRGQTATTNGLGNLIVGYDEPGWNLSARTGSHNIVVGELHGYVSYGGLVAGFDNTISGPHGSVSGGTSNIASGGLASVSGGNNNTAAEDQSHVP